MLYVLKKLSSIITLYLLLINYYSVTDGIIQLIVDFRHILPVGLHDDDNDDDDNDLWFSCLRVCVCAC